MKFERLISTQKGPEINRTIGSTVVKAKGDGGYWITTVNLSDPKDAYETLIFSIPTNVNVATDKKGIKDFTEIVILKQASDLPVAIFNTTNMSKKEAKINHKEAVRAAKTTLKHPSR